MFGCNHLSLSVTDLERSFEFYAQTLQLPVLGKWPHMFAVRAGDVRISAFQSPEPVTPSTGVQIILRTDAIEHERDRLVNAGVQLENDIVEAPGFMRFFTFADPSGHIIHVGQYAGDPLVAA